MSWTGGLNDPNSALGNVLAIVGPTAVGKSTVAVAVAARLGGEIVALDSRQIYRHMVVGTDQPREGDRRGIPHHLYGILEPEETISAGQYAHLAREKIEEIFSRNGQPIVCGGSGLYFRALARGLFEGSSSDPTVRKRLECQLRQNGAAVLSERLNRIDPYYAAIVHPNDHKRLLRALEIYEITGIPPSEHFQKGKADSPPFRFFTVYLRVSVDLLKDRISQRIERMLASGWVEEVENLLARGYSRDVHPMDSLGYRQIMRYLDGKMDLDEMVKLINIQTRQFAKKQLKWFDREEVAFRLDISRWHNAEEMAVIIVDAFKKGLTQPA